jgi:hypothetical protein
MTPAQWLRISAHINTMWPHQPTLPTAVADGYDLLADLDAEQIARAVQALILDGREFSPSAGQIRRKIAEMEEPPQIWGEVWYEIQKAISHHGSYSNPESIEWSNPNVAELVRLKGWQYLCTTTDPLSVVEAQARQVWDDLRERRMRERAYAPLQGDTLHRLVDPALIDS